MIKIPLSVISCPWLSLRPQSASSAASSHFGQNPKNFYEPSWVLTGPAGPCALKHNRTHTHKYTLVWIVRMKNKMTCVSLWWQVISIFLLIFYLPTAVLRCRAFSLVCDLADILGCRRDNALGILFSHLNKVIQVHQLCGWENTKQAIIQGDILYSLSLSLSLCLDTYTPCWPCSPVLSGSGLKLGQESCLQCHLLVGNEHNISELQTLPWRPASNVIFFTMTAANTEIYKGEYMIHLTAMAAIILQHAAAFCGVCCASGRIVVTI